jgi:hypothetical protein
VRILRRRRPKLLRTRERATARRSPSEAAEVRASSRRLKSQRRRGRAAEDRQHSCGDEVRHSTAAGRPRRRNRTKSYSGAPLRIKLRTRMLLKSINNRKAWRRCKAIALGPAPNLNGRTAVAGARGVELHRAYPMAQYFNSHSPRSRRATANQQMGAWVAGDCSSELLFTCRRSLCPADCILQTVGQASPLQVDRLLKEADRSCVHCPRAYSVVRIGGYENDGNVEGEMRQMLL